MVENIFAGVLGVVAVAAGILGWWLENGSVKEDSSKKDKEHEGIK